MPAPRLRIRRAELTDGGAIGEAHAAAWLQAYRDLFDPPFLRRAASGRRATWPQRLDGLLAEDALVLVGELDGHVVAFSHAGPSHEDPGVAEVYGFYSAPDAWGTGLASALMSETCSWLAGRWDRVVVWTHQDAGRARRFYEKAGFEATGLLRVQALSDLTTGETAQVPAVQYAKALTEAAAARS